MPHSSNSGRLLFRLVLFTLAGWALWALGKNDAKPGAVDEMEATDPTRKQGGFSKRRLATSIAFTTIFFAGAAFTAGAVGEKVCDVGDICDGVTTVAEPPTDSTPAPPLTKDLGTGSESVESTPTPPAPPLVEDSSNGESAEGNSGAGGEGQSTGEAGGQEEPGTETSNEGAAPAPGDEDGSSAGDGGAASGGDGSGGADQPAEEPDVPAVGPGSPSHTGDPVQSHDANGSPVDVDEAHSAAAAAESAGSFGTFWLHRVLPDPTPPAKRLDPRFARTLVSVSRNQHVDWALVLGVVRAHGNRTSVPATKHQLRTLASHLRQLHASKDAWQAVLALEGRTTFADRAIALRNYNRAVGVWTLVHGLVASKTRLQDRVLGDQRIDIYAGGRSDVASGRVDVRVLALIRYLAEAHGQVTVSCLITGHGLYARPGVISAHIYGEAVDISALGGVSIYGNQQPGGVTERAVRNILLLPVELRPKQVISLLGLGGPSFALANHYDHIHVGY